MIQESNSFETFLQNMPFARIGDQSETLLNGPYIAMEMQNYEQEQEQVFDPNLQVQLQQQQQHQQQEFNENVYQQQQQQQQQNLEDQQFSCVNYGDPPTPEETTAKDLNISNLSDASTTEGLICSQSDEQYAYLKELNSDNLMQISQQSVLQEMILKHHAEVKPNLNVLPTFEERDFADYNFKIIVPTIDKKRKANWAYSESLNKLYIRMNNTFTVEAVYTPKLPVQQLRIRAFICYAKEVCEPIRRCQNHLSNDNEPHSIKRESLLRCENPGAEYSGSSEGKSIKERYSVSVPLNMCALHSGDKTVKQPIALKFTCQNSCIGRKETGIMFLLEGMNGEILSQRLLNVRICSSPKRDKKIDEKNAATTTTTKRKSENDDMYETYTKIRRRDSRSSPDSPIIKDENSSDFETAAHNYNIKRNPTGGYRLVITVSRLENALGTIENAYSRESVCILNKSKNIPLAKQCFKNLNKLYETFR